MDLKSNMQESDWFQMRRSRRAVDACLDLNSYGLTAVDAKEAGLYDVTLYRECKAFIWKGTVKTYTVTS